MKSTKFIGLLAGATLVVANLFGGLAHAAGSASFSLSPSGGTYNINSTFSLMVSETSTDAVNVVTAKLSYDASKLQYVGVDASGSGFGGDASTSGGAGSITISRYVTPAGSTVTGTQNVASVNFKALVGSGSTSVTFAAGSQIASNGSNVWNGSTTGGTYTLATPAPAPTPAPTPTPVTGGMGGGSSAPVTNNSSSNNSNTNNTVGANSTTPATGNTTPAANGEVKSDTTKKDAKKTDTTKSVAVKKSGRTVWPWVILIALGTTTVIYGMRNRKAAVSDAKPVAQEAVKAAVVPAAVAAKKATVPASKTVAKQSAAQNRKKSDKKAGKKSR
jgi:hypothetical protein